MNSASPASRMRAFVSAGPAVDNGMTLALGIGGGAPWLRLLVAPATAGSGRGTGIHLNVRLKLTFDRDGGQQVPGVGRGGQPFRSLPYCLAFATSRRSFRLPAEASRRMMTVA